MRVTHGALIICYTMIMTEPGFPCIHCGKFIPITEYMGTDFRNHCPFCLWSKHVDDHTPGDRASPCQKEMQPLGLTFKHEGVDKYGRTRQGELMIVHKCRGCSTYNINRIAADDVPNQLMALFESSLTLPKKEMEKLEEKHIDLCREKDRKEITIQLFGKQEL